MKATGKKIITSLRRSAVGNLLLSSTNELDAEVLPEFDAGVGRKHADLRCCDSVVVRHHSDWSEGNYPEIIATFSPARAVAVSWAGSVLDNNLTAKRGLAVQWRELQTSSVPIPTEARVELHLCRCSVSR